VRYLGLGFGIVAVDQLTKLWIQRHVALGDARPLLGGLVYLTHAQNPGGAFGLFPHQNWLFFGVMVLLVVLVVKLVYPMTKRSPLLCCGLSLGLAGAVGNLIDRLRVGRVIDFIDVGFWPVFNVADGAIVIGVALLFWELLGGRAAK
jgi:signal peptidase II